MKKIIKYFSPKEKQSLFERQKTNAFIIIAFISISLSVLFLIHTLLQKTENIQVTLLSIFLINSFTIFSLFLLRKKGIKITGNFFSIGIVTALLITLNILNPNINTIYKYFQGFYVIFSLLGTSLLFASRKVLLFNVIIILLSTTHVYIFAINQSPQLFSLLSLGYVTHTLSLLILSVAIYFSIKFSEVALNKANKSLKIKEKQNKALIKAKKKIEDNEKKILLKNQELETSEEEIKSGYEELRATNYALNESYKKLEAAKKKAEESDKLKTEFIQNLSHEIRTPMNGIIGFSSFLNKPDITTEQRTKYVEIIRSSSNQLLRIIDDILEISLLGTNQEELIEESVSLNELFTELCLIFELKTKQKGIDLQVVKPLSDKESTIITDNTKLHKILSNLIENSIKFTKTGFIKFGYKKDNGKILLYVEDTGIGIKPENYEMIFKKFSQEEKEISQKTGGLGLGLSIVKENVKLLGGKIDLKSTKGKGTTFFVTIPYKSVYK